eukprot:scaffold699_cov385-Prasinococcus_capsulatus_cf.AAC.19
MARTPVPARVLAKALASSARSRIPRMQQPMIGDHASPVNNRRLLISDDHGSLGGKVTYHGRGDSFHRDHRSNPN